MYVAVKGGEAAIAAAHRLLGEVRRGDPSVRELTAEQIDQQLALAVDRVMAEGSLYDRELAAVAIKQARGDLIEAIFLVRAFRTTLPRFGFTEPADTSCMRVRRRISATYKDLPGGQILGPTFDYTHRLIDPDLAGQAPEPQSDETSARQHLSTEPSADAPGSGVDGAGMDAAHCGKIPHVSTLLDHDGMIEPNPAANADGVVGDITREPLAFPADRDSRLQALARGDEGFLLAMGYSTQRGFGRTHPFAGEIRFGDVDVGFVPEELGFEVPLGRVALTECEMVNQFIGSETQPPQFTRGYGLVFGQLERKAMSMALVDRALRADELGEETGAPAQDQEFVLSHADNVQSTGFVEHLKLPHYVDFQAELGLLRTLRAEHAARRAAANGDDTAGDIGPAAGSAEGEGA